MEKIIRIYTDTFVKSNPGSAAFGVILEFGDKQKEIAKGYKQTTKPRIELLSVIAGFEELKPGAEDYMIEIYTTSKQIVKAVKDNWSTKTNIDLWNRFKWYYDKYKPLIFPVSATKRTKNNGKCYKLAQNSLKTKLFDDKDYLSQRQNKRLERINKVKNKLTELDILYDLDKNSHNLRLNLTYFDKNGVIIFEYSNYSFFYQSGEVKQYKNITEAKLFKYLKEFINDDN